MANVFCYHQSASVNMQWVSDWWRYPALVFPLDAMWRAYENARKAPGQMMIFYIQAASMLDRVFDKDRGIVASLDCKQNLTRKGEPLPCTPEVIKEICECDSEFTGGLMLRIRTVARIGELEEVKN